MKFQHNYSQNFPAVRDATQRRKKAKKILAALEKYFHLHDISGALLLEIGCSGGAMSEVFALAGASVTALDIDLSALVNAPRSEKNINNYILSDAGTTPFPTETFDIIVCSQVYEHYPNFQLLIQEIFRLLSPNGICYFSGPNKFAFIEEHYHLPFLSWVPRRIANIYVRIAGVAEDYYEKPKTFWQLREAMHQFKVIDLTREILTNPAAYLIEERVSGKFVTIFRVLPNFLWPLIERFVPNFNWVLKKSL